MRVSRAQAEENRKAIISAAGRLFRERGYDGIGLADLMKAVGLTHGGFYKKFASKEDLARQASAQALVNTRSKWLNRAATSRGKPLAAVVNGYLSTEHRDNPGDGCSFAALGAEASRSDDPELRRIFEAEAVNSLELLQGILSQQPDEATRDRSIAVLSTMVGAVLMSRLIEDPELSGRFLDASASAILETP